MATRTVKAKPATKTVVKKTRPDKVEEVQTRLVKVQGERLIRFKEVDTAVAVKHIVRVSINENFIVIMQSSGGVFHLPANHPRYLAILDAIGPVTDV
jgi:hypothetical protein